MIPIQQHTILNKLHDGAETVLYRGVRDADKVPVVIKLPRSDYPEPKEIARLRHEFSILRDLEVSGVIRALGLEKCGRGVALILEDSGWQALSHVLKEKRLGLGEALRVTLSAARALEAIHARGVIHKDIKPHNILVDAEASEACLIDFGIAARLPQETQKPAPPAGLEGTLAYLSPEQTGRMNRVVDRRSDLYSLGVTLYEMLTGAPPFTSHDPTELIQSHIARTPATPREHNAKVPAILSDIVMKLLAKTAEERYQTARGLRIDLERCLSEWKARGDVASFPLGLGDFPDELAIPQKLYGREAEQTALFAAFERTRKGDVELLMVAGYSGVGKSALVSEIHKPIARHGGYFAAGKFDPMTRDIPLAPLVHALRELTRQILAEPAAALEVWRASLLTALGPNGRLLIELIPELEHIIGQQPPVPELGTSEAQNRFELVFQRFLRVFSTQDHPLVVFLDDLQWADPASLKLLRVLLTDPESHNLLVIGAYRENEVDPAHPLVATLDDLKKADVGITTITLQPLGAATLTEIVADTLRAKRPDVEPLAGLVFEKTQGNPFFLYQFLKAVHRAKLLSVDPASGAFVWDLESVRRAMVTDNVIDLLVGKLARLDPATQHVVKLASCIGHEFDIRTLSTIHGRSARQTSADLWEALQEGLVVPLDSDYRLLEPGGEDADGEPAPAFRVSYKFLHDRVQQAAYSLIEESRRRELHLQIGRLLWSTSGSPPRDEDLLEIVRHMNLGSAASGDAAERTELARLNLRAGRKVKAATAYQAAAGHFREGIALLGDDGWEQEPELVFALQLEAAECESATGALEQADARFADILPRAKSDLQRARIQNLRVVLYTMLGKFAEAVKSGFEGLALLGVELPGEGADPQAAFGAEMMEAVKGLGDRKIDDLIKAPVTDDPELTARLQILADLCIPIYYVNPMLYGVIVLKQVNLSLKHGHTRMSAFGYVTFGFLLNVVIGQPEAGYAYGRLALALNEKLNNPVIACKIYSIFCGSLYMFQPIREILPYYDKARSSAMEVGDFLYLSQCAYGEAMVKLGMGKGLGDLLDDLDRDFAIAARTGDVTAKAVFTLVQQAALNLQGDTRARDSLADDDIDDDALLKLTNASGQGVTALIYHLIRAQVLFIHGHYAEAAAASSEAQTRAWAAMGMYYTTEVPLYGALSLAALAARTDDAEEKQRHLAALAPYKEQLAKLAALAPQNFGHKVALIDAEVARAQGDRWKALELYDEAIRLARVNEFPHHEAIANELCGKFYLSLGREKAASAYLADAYLGYRHWGAKAKAQDLVDELPEILRPITEGRASGFSRSTATSSSWTSSSQPLPSTVTSTSTLTVMSRTIAGSLREAAVVVRAAQLIASELDLTSLIRRLMQIVLANSGAQRGALILERDGRLTVEADFNVDTDSVVVGPSVALEERNDIAQTAALYAVRTREPLVVDDATASPRLAADPYVIERRPKSILCLPLVHQERVSGVLYLENNAAAGAFSEARIEVLAVLSSQASIAIENALLVAEAQLASEQVRRINERLEAEVAQRTEEIRRTNAELCSTNERLQVELVERERAEQERSALQERMIQAQKALLAEMSTPLIPITESIMVMPLIGTMDAERAAQVMEVALGGAQRSRAGVVILDITGLRHMDKAVAESLTRTASALRLLGTRAIVTGVRPEVAQAMVSLQINMDTIVTRSTLQSGIAYALAMCRGR